MLFRLRFSTQCDAPRPTFGMAPRAKEYDSSVVGILEKSQFPHIKKAADVFLRPLKLTLLFLMRCRTLDFGRLNKPFSARSNDSEGFPARYYRAFNDKTAVERYLVNPSVFRAYLFERHES